MMSPVAPKNTDHAAHFRPQTSLPHRVGGISGAENKKSQSEKLVFCGRGLIWSPENMLGDAESYNLLYHSFLECHRTK
jgi:hypothetical protein